MAPNQEVEEREYQPIQVRRDILRERNKENYHRYTSETDIYRRMKLKRIYLLGKLEYLDVFSQCVCLGLNWYKGEKEYVKPENKIVLH